MREALKLALEALNHYEKAGLATVKTIDAITAINKALAQPEQEPVIWMYQNKSTHEVRFQKHMRSFVDHGAWYEVPLYSEPLANQEKTSGSPKPAKPEALRLADAMEYDLDWCDEAAAELRRMHDLLGKANALCRIRAEEIERLKAQPEQEPVGYIDHADGSVVWFSKPALGALLYTTPPYVPTERQRKPLTDEQEREAFEKWCFSVGLMAESYGILSESSHCGTAWKAWKAKAAHGIKE